MPHLRRAPQRMKIPIFMAMTSNLPCYLSLYLVNDYEGCQAWPLNGGRIFPFLPCARVGRVKKISTYLILNPFGRYLSRLVCFHISRGGSALSAKGIITGLVASMPTFVFS